MWYHLSHARVLKLEELMSMHIYIYIYICVCIYIMVVIGLEVNYLSNYYIKIVSMIFFSVFL